MSPAPMYVDALSHSRAEARVHFSLSHSLLRLYVYTFSFSPRAIAPRARTLSNRASVRYFICLIRILYSDHYLASFSAHEGGEGKKPFRQHNSPLFSLLSPPPSLLPLRYENILSAEKAAYTRFFAEKKKTEARKYPAPLTEKESKRNISVHTFRT